MRTSTKVEVVAMGFEDEVIRLKTIGSLLGDLSATPLEDQMVRVTFNLLLGEERAVRVHLYSPGWVVQRYVESPLPGGCAGTIWLEILSCSFKNLVLAGNQFVITAENDESDMAEAIRGITFHLIRR